ncbi:hypothetical protein GCM10027517_17620 [Phycicoccus ginsengisoli]
MPSATEMRNDIFIADHGSIRLTVSFTRRWRTPGTPPTGRAWGLPGWEIGRVAVDVPGPVEPPAPWPVD